MSLLIDAKPAMGRDDLRVVVVDDEPDAAQSLTLCLQLDGYQAQAAHSADEALQLINRQPPICVILDLGMPRVSGIELMQRIRNRHGNGMVLIVLTGSKEPADEEAAEAAGVDFVLHKPLDLNKLRQMLPPVL